MGRNADATCRGGGDIDQKFKTRHYGCRRADPGCSHSVCAAFYRTYGRVFPADGASQKRCVYKRFFIWGISVKRRIIHKQTNRYIFMIAMLMVLWMTLRTLKYHILKDPDALRYMWYMYYIPMVYIPLLLFFTALSLRRSENYRLPVYIKLLAAPATALVAMVITNDIHGKVFVFPTYEGEWFDMPYTYGPGYWLLQVWNGIIVALSVALIVLKCRLPVKGKPVIMPMVPIALIILYSALYVSGVHWLRMVFGDMTAVYCLLTMLSLEACIRCRLIPSNKGYTELFEVCSIGARITDASFNIRYSSDEENIPAREMMKQAAEGGSVRTDRNNILKGKAISGGYVFWNEDIETLADVIEQMEQNMRTLAHRNEIERRRVESERRVNSLREQNRLFDMISSSTERQRGLLLDLFEEYKKAGSDSGQDRKLRRELLARAAVIGAYIKRKGNLLFLRQQGEYMPAEELRYAFEETFRNLEMTGAECGVLLKYNINRHDMNDNDSDGPAVEQEKEDIADTKSRKAAEDEVLPPYINIDDSMRAYNAAERLAEASFGMLDSVYAVIRETDKCWNIVIDAETCADLSAVVRLADESSCDSDTNSFRLVLRAGLKH